MTRLMDRSGGEIPYWQPQLIFATPAVRRTLWNVTRRHLTIKLHGSVAGGRAKQFNSLEKSAIFVGSPLVIELAMDRDWSGWINDWFVMNLRYNGGGCAWKKYFSFECVVFDSIPLYFLSYLDRNSILKWGACLDKPRQTSCSVCDMRGKFNCSEYKAGK